MKKMIVANLLVGTLFVLVKLAEVVTWPWWCVLIPFYGYWALLMASLVVWSVSWWLCGICLYLIGVNMNKVIAATLRP